MKVSKERGGKIEELMCIDISESRGRHFTREGTILTRKGLIHHECYNSTEADILVNFNAYQIIRDENQQIHEDFMHPFTSRVPNSDQIMSRIKRHKKP